MEGLCLNGGPPKPPRRGSSDGDPFLILGCPKIKYVIFTESRYSIVKM
jgi:hypothetical protein